jgi:Flp pilus assembly pilin Flp
MKTSTVITFFQDSTAQDAVEYALLTGFLCLACAGILLTLATDLGALWTYMNNLLSNPG